MKKTIAFLTLFFFNTACNANALIDQQFLFWTKPIEANNPPDTLYAPPKVAITLVNENKQPVQINDRLYQVLEKKIDPITKPLFIQQYQFGYWELVVKPQIGLQNASFIDSFIQYTEACIQSLSTIEETSAIEQLIINPDAEVDPNNVEDSIKRLFSHYKPITEHMYAIFQQNRCKTISNNYQMSSLIKKRLQLILEEVLLGEDSLSVSPQELFIISQLFKPLYFGKKGFWVRHSLSMLKTRLEQVLLTSFPTDKVNLLTTQYNNFFSFIRATPQLGDSQLGLITGSCFSSLSELSLPFKFSTCKQENNLTLYQFTIGQQSGLLISKGFL